jgi:hypothetical protein
MASQNEARRFQNPAELRHRCRKGHGRRRPDGSCRIIRKPTRGEWRDTFSYRNLFHPERRFQRSRYYLDSYPSIAVLNYERHHYDTRCQHDHGVVDGIIGVPSSSPALFGLKEFDASLSNYRIFLCETSEYWGVITTSRVGKRCLR